MRVNIEFESAFDEEEAALRLDKWHISIRHDRGRYILGLMIRSQYAGWTLSGQVGERMIVQLLNKSRPYAEYE